MVKYNKWYCNFFFNDLYQMNSCLKWKKYSVLVVSSQVLLNYKKSTISLILHNIMKNVQIVNIQLIKVVQKKK